MSQALISCSDLRKILSLYLIMNLLDDDSDASDNVLVVSNQPQMAVIPPRPPPDLPIDNACLLTCLQQAIDSHDQLEPQQMWNEPTQGKKEVPPLHDWKPQALHLPRWVLSCDDPPHEEDDAEAVKRKIG